MKVNWNVWGLVASLLCLAHCLLLPFAFSLLPLLAQYYLTSPWAHVLLIILALIPAWQIIKEPYAYYPKSRFVRGLAIFSVMTLVLILVLRLLVSFTKSNIHLRLALNYEVHLMTLASICLVLAHLIRYRYRQSCFRA